MTGKGWLICHYVEGLPGIVLVFLFLQYPSLFFSGVIIFRNVTVGKKLPFGDLDLSLVIHALIYK